MPTKTCGRSGLKGEDDPRGPPSSKLGQKKVYENRYGGW